MPYDQKMAYFNKFIEQFEDKTPLNTMKILSFWNKKMLEKIKKGHCV